MEIRNLQLAIIGVCGVYASSAVAIEPASISAGAIDIIPQLTVRLSHNDNIYSEQTNKDSSFITVLNPSVEFVAEKESNAYRVTYDIKHGIYRGASADNYTDHNLSAEAVMDLDARNNFTLTAALAKAHEDRGSTEAGTGAEPSRYTDKSVAGIYQYGAEGAKGNLELTANYLDHRFDNFRAGTVNNASRDRDNLTVGGTFFYRVAPKTKALLELRQEVIDYVASTSTQDSTERKYLAGVAWDATAKTSGTAKLGYAEKNFDDIGVNDQSGVSWEIAGRWSPKTYSTFDLTASQEYEESSGTGVAVDTQTLGLAWNHAWNQRLSTLASVTHTIEDFVDAEIPREDNKDELKLGVNYELERWLSMNLDYTYTDADSSDAAEGYTGNIFMLTLKGSL